MRRYGALLTVVGACVAALVLLPAPDTPGVPVALHLGLIALGATAGFALLATSSEALVGRSPVLRTLALATVSTAYLLVLAQAGG